jgi:hypothetical protein
MKIKTLFLVLVIGIFIIISTPRNSLASMQKIELPELTSRSEVIVLGSVTHIESRLEDGIFTYVTISVEQIIKGSILSSHIFIRLPGGEVGETTLTASDVPKFTVGENIIVFLKADGAYYNLFGLYQSKYTVQENTVLENSQPLEVFIQDIKTIINSQTILNKEVLQ